MVKITNNVNCGNAPKKQFLEKLNSAFVNGDDSFIAGCVEDDIDWNLIGDQNIRGKQTFLQAFKKMSDQKTAELIIERIITHGKEGAVSGKILMKDGRRYAFCDVYEFSSAKGVKIKSIQSYVIQSTNP